MYLPFSPLYDPVKGNERSGIPVGKAFVVPACPESFLTIIKDPSSCR